MKINKFKYEALGEIKKIYLNNDTIKIREKLNKLFKSSLSNEDGTGILCKYLKKEGLYRIKYIFKRNAQLQPITMERYYYLVSVDSDDNGTFIEYVMVYDKTYEPLVRVSYILVALFIALFLLYKYKTGDLSSFSVGFLIFMIACTVFLILRKSNETADLCRKAEKIFCDYLLNL